MNSAQDQSNINLPNVLSVIRILLIPLALWGMIKEEYLFALSILIMAGITDALDGFLARRLGQFTEVGRVLDPLADKMLFIAVFLTMGFGLELFPMWFSWVIILRDFLILAGFFILVWTSKDRTVSPTLSGKIHTILLFIFLCLVLLSLSYGTPIPINILLYIMVGSTIISFLDYLRLWVKRMSTD